MSDNDEGIELWFSRNQGEAALASLKRVMKASEAEGDMLYDEVLEEIADLTITLSEMEDD